MRFKALLYMNLRRQKYSVPSNSTNVNETSAVFSSILDLKKRGNIQNSEEKSSIHE